MIKPIGLEEIAYQPPVYGPDAGRTVAQLTDPLKRRLIWFIQWQSHQDGGLKRFAYQLLRAGSGCSLGSATMHRAGFNAETVFKGAQFEAICDELDFHPVPTLDKLHAAHASICQHIRQQVEFRELYQNDSLVPTEKNVQAAIENDQQLVEIESQLDPNRRKHPAIGFLYECRARALTLPKLLSQLCTDSNASWSAPFLRNLKEGLEDALHRHAVTVSQSVASTGIRKIVEDALSFAHSTKTLGVIDGPERIGKSAGAQTWCAANPDKARYINLTAATTEMLFYQEIFAALGCEPKESTTTSELRGQIRNTLQNRDIALIFDEGHCLFGLSEKASIKRLEYIRTEFVNRNIPVALIITPQFAARLGELEKKTSFNVNQLRGRIGRWTALPKRPTRGDIECLCKFRLPGLSAECYHLLCSFAVESEYPFAAIVRAATEIGVVAQPGGDVKIDEQAIKKAIGFALFTAQQVSQTIPCQPKAGRTRRVTPRIIEPMQNDAADLPLQRSGNACAAAPDQAGNDEIYRPTSRVPAASFDDSAESFRQGRDASQIPSLTRTRAQQVVTAT